MLMHCVFLPELCRFAVAFIYYGVSLNITAFGFNMYLTHFIYAAVEVPAKADGFIYWNNLIQLFGQRIWQ